MKQKEKLPLPIDPYLDQIVRDAHGHSTLLIKASPGSGKTTRLPWAIARNSSKKVLVLEPRRLAAKLAAQRIAYEESFETGEEVGFHFRFEKKISPDSKLIFYTEGTFLRTFLNSPELDEVGTVILDEFHERHIETDVALAALRSLQKKRQDLKIILMSATLDTQILDYFDNFKIIEIEAPRFPVEIHYLPNVPSELNQKLEKKVKNILSQIRDEGDVLVFVPGMREMLQIEDHLGEEYGEALLLHADLSREEQEKALTPQARRKIILATNIAESSVTIPGIKYVIDSGIQREAHYSPWTGLKSLQDRPITQSSAIQRAGRAGRTSPGECFRLYSQQDYNERETHTIPEILRADLTDTSLLVSEFKQELTWLTPPPTERWLKAQELNYKMGAVDEKGSLTPIGKKMMSYPLDARISRALVAGEKFNGAQKRKLLKFICEELENDRYGTLWKKLQFYLKDEGPLPDAWEKALLPGFIDQVAKFRSKQHDFIHYSGKTLKAHQSLRELQDGFYLVLDITQRMEAILVVPIEEEWAYEIEPFPFSEEDTISVGESIQIKSQTKFGSILMDETLVTSAWSELNQDSKEKILIQTRHLFQKRLNDWKQQENYQRYHFWARVKNLSLEEIEDILSAERYFEDYGLFLDQIENYFQATLHDKLELSGIEQELPTRIDLGGKRELQIHYPIGMDPYVEAPIQDFYGQNSTPTILRGKIPLTLKLLGPHKRPIQVTKDLVGFWSRMYPEMKKEWQRDYPRHYWPEDPARAKPFLLKRQVT